jgi:tetratricopeptide (TPR) repeat protein
MNKKSALITVLFLLNIGVGCAQHPHPARIYNMISGGPNSGLPYTAADRIRDATCGELYHAGNIALEAGDFALAESDVKQEMQLEPRNDLPLPILAAALEGQGKDAAAMDVCARLDSENERQPYVLLPYSLLLLKHGQWSRALSIYYQTLPFVGSFLINGHDLLVADSSYSPDTPEPADLEVDIRIAMSFACIDECGRSDRGTRNRALTESAKALALEPESPLANLSYASSLERVGDAAGAAAIFEKVSKKYTGDEKAAADSELTDGHLIMYLPQGERTTE